MADKRLSGKPVSGNVDLNCCSTTLTVNGALAALGPVLLIIDLTPVPLAAQPFLENVTFVT